MNMREALEEAVRLFETYGLVADSVEAGAWINNARAALAPPHRSLAGTTPELQKLYEEFDMDDLVPRLEDHGLYTKAERMALFIEARDEIVRLRTALAATPAAAIRKFASQPEQPAAASPQYFDNCPRGGECHGMCNNGRCPHYGRIIVARRCIEDLPPGAVMPKEEA